MPERSSLASRLKAFSPPQLALVALGSLALAGGGVAANVVFGADGTDRALTGGDQDLAGGRIPNGGLTRPSTPAQQIKAAGNASAPTTTVRSGAAASSRSASTRSPASKTTPAPAGSGGPSGPSAPGGPKGDTRGAGPKGNTPAAGPVTVNARAGNETGAPGPTGDTGSSGPTGDAPNSNGNTAPAAAPKPPRTPAAPAPAVFVVKDADGTTAGTLLSSDPNADWLMFSYKNRTFVANSRTGVLDLPAVDTSYATDDCSGTPYAPLSRPAKSVLRSSNPNENGIYEFGEPGSVDVRSIWQTGDGGQPDMCLQYVYTNTALAPLQQLSADDRPPTLDGPLKAVPAS